MAVATPTDTSHQSRKAAEAAPIRSGQPGGHDRCRVQGMHVDEEREHALRLDHHRSGASPLSAVATEIWRKTFAMARATLASYGESLAEYFVRPTSRLLWMWSWSRSTAEQPGFPTAPSDCLAAIESLYQAVRRANQVAGRLIAPATSSSSAMTARAHDSEDRNPQLPAIQGIRP